MSIPSNYFTSYEAVGLREDLIGVITNISPVETMITNLTGDTEAKQRYHEWQTDTLDTPAANAVIEGNIYAATAISATTRAGNYTQILQKKFAVTKSEEAFKKAGRGSEVEYQKTEKALKGIANDIEYALIINASQVSGSSSTARQLQGMLGWITTNVSSATANREISADIVNAHLQVVWAAGGKPTMLVCGGFQKRKLSAALTNLNSRDINAAEKKIVFGIGVYESDFGPVNIKAHHVMNTSAPSKILVLGDMGLWKKAWGRDLNVEELGPDGSGRRILIEAELTLESRNEAGSGQITNLTTS